MKLFPKGLFGYLFLIFIVAGFYVGQRTYKYGLSNPIDLAIDMEVDQGGYINVYINDETRPPYSMLLNPGHRNVYLFRNVPAVIHRIRIDPINNARASVKIYGLTFSRGEKKLQQISGADLQKWNLINIHPIESNKDFFQFESVTGQPIIVQDISYVFNKSIEKVLKLFRNSLPIQKLAEFFINPQNIPVLALLLGMLFLVIFGLKNPVHFVLYPFLMLLCLFMVGGRIVNLCLNRVGKAPSISHAVGMASYLGYSKSLETLSFCAIVLVAILIALAFFAIYHIYHKRVAGNSMMRTVNQGHMDRPVSVPFLSILLFLYAVLGFPQLNQAYINLEHAKHIPNWDALNMLTWQYETQMGWLPFKDFWFPYVSFTSIASPIPWDMVHFYLHNFAVFALFVIAIYWLAGKSKSWTIIISVSVLFLIETGYINGTSRYFMALDYVLLFLVLQREKRAHYFHYALYGGALGLLSMSDPLQAVYAGFPILIQLLIYLARTKDKGQQRLYLKKVALAASVFVVFILVYGVLLWRQGQLNGFIYFYRHFNTLSVSCAIPSGLISWFKLKPAPNNLLVYLMIFFIMYGVYLSLVKKGHANPRCGDILLSTGLLSFVLFQKNLVRMHMAPQIIGIIIVGGLLYLYEWSRHWNRVQRYTCILLLVFLIGFEQANWLTIGKRYLEGTSHLFSNIKILVKNHEEMKQRIHSFFSAQSFENFNGANEFSQYYEESMKSNPDTTFYVLGDESFFYILAKQKPPYYFIFYGNDVFNQNIITEWLEKNKVEFVIWNPASTDFDTVPHLVRVPIIFNYVIKHYEPYGSFSIYQVLKRKEPLQPVCVEFWRRYLGDTIDLGHLPSISSISEMSNCDSPALSECCDFLQVKVTGDKVNQKRTIQTNAGNFPFKILFWQNQRDDAYYIYLDRIWFWNCLKQENLTPELDRNQDKNLALDIIHKECKQYLLY